MSLAIVWSYFHALRESDSPLARHFVVIAPNLTVFERLKEDFGNGRIFDHDPLIPVAWKGDFNLTVVLQDTPVERPQGELFILPISIAFMTREKGRPGKRPKPTNGWDQRSPMEAPWIPERPCGSRSRLMKRLWF